MNLDDFSVPTYFNPVFLKTFESHLAGRPHQKKMAQAGRAKKLEEKVTIQIENAGADELQYWTNM